MRTLRVNGFGQIQTQDQGQVVGKTKSMVGQRVMVADLVLKVETLLKRYEKACKASDIVSPLQKCAILKISCIYCTIILLIPIIYM